MCVWVIPQYPQGSPLRWCYLLAFLFSLSSRVPSETHWKLSYTENFQRMRLKLTRNYSFNPHTDASHARDNIPDETDAREASLPVRVAKEAVVQNVDEDVLDVEEPGSPVATGTKERLRTISETEKSVLGELERLQVNVLQWRNIIIFIYCCVISNDVKKCVECPDLFQMAFPSTAARRPGYK